MSILKRFIAICAMSSGLWVVSAHADPTLGFETPEEGATISGRVSISGWAVDPVGIDEVKLYIDGVKIGHIPYGSLRQDVGNAFPGISGSENSGFARIYNSRKLSNGPHVFSVEAENLNSDKTTISRTVVISNEPGPDFPRPEIDLSEASARIVNGTIFLDNVLIGGTMFTNLDLVFDPVGRKFSFAAFGEDLNGDGYRDDDLDQDGFSDDDLDQDGFRDDDDGTVQPGVPLALAEVKGQVTSVNGNTVLVSSTDPDHGGLVGVVTVDITNALLDDSLGGNVEVGDALEAKGSWDGTVLHAVFVELDD